MISEPPINNWVFHIVRGLGKRSLLMLGFVFEESFLGLSLLLSIFVLPNNGVCNITVLCEDTIL